MYAFDSRIVIFCTDAAAVTGGDPRLTLRWSGGGMVVVMLEGVGDGILHGLDQGDAADCDGWKGRCAKANLRHSLSIIHHLPKM